MIEIIGDYRELAEITSLGIIERLILDFFDFHVRIGAATDDIQTQSAQLMWRFIAMLERGDYRKSREVSYYASELCVTPKYLSEVSKQVSGQSANYWINRFAVLDISRLLRARRMNLVEIADLFEFSSASYFSRYVQRYLGQSPSEYRG